MEDIVFAKMNTTESVTDSEVNIEERIEESEIIEVDSENNKENKTELPEQKTNTIENTGSQQSIKKVVPRIIGVKLSTLRKCDNV